jgi:hypothetical protein
MNMAKKNITISYIIVYKFYSLLGHICRILFSVFSPKKIIPKKGVSNIHLLLFSGQKGTQMIKPVLMSVYNTWEKIPFITIVTDGMPVENVERVMKFWPYPYKVKSWEESAAFHLERDRHSLVAWARINIFSRKLLAILAEAELRPTLYCDTDVLWFAEPRLPAVNNGFTMRISQDNIHTYYMPLLRWLNRHDMLDKPALNAGLIFLSGTPYDNYKNFGQLIDIAQFFNEGSAEQLVFALIADQLGDTWTPEEIIVNIRDLHWPLIPSYFFSGNHFARHHVLTKNSWFWRDALYILLFKKKYANG